MTVVLLQDRIYRIPLLIFLGNNLPREIFFADNLVDVGIARVEDTNLLWDHAGHVYWHFVLPKKITLYMTIRWYKFYFNVFADKIKFKFTYYQ